MPTRAEGLSLAVQTPCEADWDSMAGNEEVRFCAHCEKSVHNVSAMTRKEAMRFVRANAGGVCVRFHSDPKGRTLHLNEGKLHRITRRASKAAAGAFGAIVALSSTALAQTNGPADAQKAAATRVMPRTSAALTGTILDPNGALVVGASVTVTNKETGEVITVKTDAEGVYLFELIPAGTYRVEFGAEGFASKSVEKVELQPGVEWRQDSMLAIETEESAQAIGAEETEEDSEEAGEDASCPTDASDASKSAETKQEASKQEESKSGEAEGQEITELPLRPEGGGRRLVTMGLVVRISPEDPLVKAIYERDARAAKNLIALGANVNVLDKEAHTTALIESVMNGDAELVSALLGAGADVNMKDTDGDTPLTSLNEGSNAALARMLINAGAKVNHRNDDGATPLMRVAENDTPEVLKELIEAGAKVSAKDKSGWTPLLHAAQFGVLANVKLLLDAGADVNARDKDGNTPLKMAKDLLNGLMDAEAAADEPQKSKGAKEPKESDEVKEAKKLVELLVSYGAIE